MLITLLDFMRVIEPKTFYSCMVKYNFSIVFLRNIDNSRCRDFLTTLVSLDDHNSGVSREIKSAYWRHLDRLDFFKDAFLIQQQGYRGLEHDKLNPIYNKTENEELVKEIQELDDGLSGSSQMKELILSEYIFIPSVYRYSALTIDSLQSGT